MKRTAEILLVAVVAILAWGLAAVASPARVGVESAAAQAPFDDDSGDDDDDDDDDDDSGDDDDPSGPPPAVAPPGAGPPSTTSLPSPPAQAPSSPTAGIAAAPLRPFPVVRIRGRTARTGARLSLLTISAPAGARVVVRCGGRSCPQRRTRRVSTGARLRARAFERHLRAGTVLRVWVTRPGAIGKYTRFRIRRSAAPARIDRCLVPGAASPRRCS